MGNAAKTQTTDENARRKESVRLAHNIKSLVVRFCAAQRAVEKGLVLTQEVMQDVLKNSADTDISDVNMNITKDTFLRVMQDSAVQAIMDDLDIPGERARLFQIIDV